MAATATAIKTNLFECFTFEFPPVFRFYRFLALDTILSGQDFSAAAV
jgi:hypothetical protein